jgi:hypothetical protein
LTLRSSQTSVPQEPEISRRAKPVMLAIILLNPTLPALRGDIKGGSKV